MAPQFRQDPLCSRDLLPLATTFLFLIFVIIACSIALFFVRSYRQEDKNARRRPPKISIIPWKRNSYSDVEKQGLLGNNSPTPMTPDSIPEIRITFPEEEDAQGRMKSGRVVIVQVGEAGVGFVRPVPEDQLVPYEYDRFSPVGLRKNDLKEEDSNAHWI